MDVLGASSLERILRAGENALWTTQFLRRLEPADTVLAHSADMDALTKAQGSGAHFARLRVAVPGYTPEPLGRDLDAHVLQHGSRVDLHNADSHRVGALICSEGRWRCYTHQPTYVTIPHLTEIRREVDDALREATAAMTSLDMARARQGLADRLEVADDVITRVSWPSGSWNPQQRLLVVSARVAVVVTIALEDEGGALTARQAQTRRTVLTELLRVSYRGLEAALSGYPSDRP